MHTLALTLGRHGRMRSVIFGGLLLITLFLQQSVLRAQKATAMPVEDDELYISVLHMISTLHNNPSASSTLTAAAIDAVLERDMGISAQDYQVLLGEAATQQKTIWNGGANGKPIQGDTRSREVLATKQRLANAMTPDGWSHFHEFVNGRFRETTSRAQLSLTGAR